MAKKKELFKGYERLQDLAGKARTELEKILKIIGKEADLSSKFLKGKINVLGLDNDIEKMYRELGKETYELISGGKIIEPGLRTIYSEINKLYVKRDKIKNEIDRFKKQIKAVPKEVER